MAEQQNQNHATPSHGELPLPTAIDGDSTSFRCRVLLCPEHENGSGGFSVYALDLPGVVSQGETEDEAIANIREALGAAIGIYLESGEIPWEKETAGRVEGAIERWVLVNA